MLKIANALEYLEDVRQAQQWLFARGLNVSNNRFSHALKFASKMVAQGEVTGAETMVRFQWALQELDDYVQLYRYLSEVDSEDFKETLKKSLKGSLENKDEGKSFGGRNFMFELTTAAFFAQLGITVTFERDADARLSFDNIDVFIECKQAVEENIDELVTDASKQIRDRCGNTESEFGIAVLGLNRFFIKHSHQNGPQFSGIDEMMEHWREVSSRFNFSYVAKEFPRVLGVLVRMCIPIWNPNDLSLIILRRNDFHPLHPPNHPALQRLKAQWDAYHRKEN